MTDGFSHFCKEQLGEPQRLPAHPKISWTEAKATEAELTETAHPQARRGNLSSKCKTGPHSGSVQRKTNRTMTSSECPSVRPQSLHLTTGAGLGSQH